MSSVNGAVPTTIIVAGLALAGYALLRSHARRTAAAKAEADAATADDAQPVVATPTGPDQWRPFAALTGIEVVRSIAFFGVNTFIELYWIRHLDASRGLAGAALQGLMRNPLVEPGLVGVSGGAALGAVGAFYSGAALLYPAALQFAGFGGAWWCPVASASARCGIFGSISKSASAAPVAITSPSLP